MLFLFFDPSDKGRHGRSLSTTKIERNRLIDLLSFRLLLSPLSVVKLRSTDHFGHWIRSSRRNRRRIEHREKSIGATTTSENPSNLMIRRRSRSNSNEIFINRIWQIQVDWPLSKAEMIIFGHGKKKRRNNWRSIDFSNSVRWFDHWRISHLIRRFKYWSTSCSWCDQTISITINRSTSEYRCYHWSGQIPLINRRKISSSTINSFRSTFVLRNWQKSTFKQETQRFQSAIESKFDQMISQIQEKIFGKNFNRKFLRSIPMRYKSKHWSTFSFFNE